MNNSGYVSQTWNFYKYFAEGAALSTRNTLGNVISPDPEYHKIPEAWGGQGIRVETQEDLAGALQAACTSSTLCLLNVNVTP